MFDVPLPALPSSSSVNCGVARPVVVNPKSWAASGWASLMITIVARLVLVNVQVTVSSSSRSIEPVSGLAAEAAGPDPPSVSVQVTLVPSNAGVGSVSTTL